MLKYRMSVRVKRAPMEFLPGLGVGVLVSQEITLTDPRWEALSEEDRAWHIATGDHASALMDDCIELVVEKIDGSDSEADVIL